MTHSELVKEIETIVQDAIRRKVIATKDSIAQTIIGNHSDHHGADAYWYSFCAYEYLRDTVRQAMHVYRPQAEEPSAQLILPGYEYLQTAYSIERNGQTVIVPIDLLTDAEIEERALEYESMAVGCRKHARELRRYRTERVQKALTVEGT